MKKQINTTRFFIIEESESVDDFAAEVELDSVLQSMTEKFGLECSLDDMDDMIFGE